MKSAVCTVQTPLAFPGFHTCPSSHTVYCLWVILSTLLPLNYIYIVTIPGHVIFSKLFLDLDSRSQQRIAEETVIETKGKPGERDQKIRGERALDRIFASPQH